MIHRLESAKTFTETLGNEKGIGWWIGSVAHDEILFEKMPSQLTQGIAVLSGIPVF
jgi:hypothetical protein